MLNFSHYLSQYVSHCKPESVDDTSTSNYSGVPKEFDGVFPKEKEGYFTEVLSEYHYTHTHVTTINIFQIPEVETCVSSRYETL